MGSFEEPKKGTFGFNQNGPLNILPRMGNKLESKLRRRIFGKQNKKRGGIKTLLIII